MPNALMFPIIDISNHMDRFVVACLFGGFLSSFVRGDYGVNPLAADREFTGVGGLSGGGATSRLLPSYPEPQLSFLLDLLFLPNYGASLNILKVEIGGDAQSTDGTEASHMHTADDLNYERGYEWWLMTEAKKRNPDIKLYGLPWAFPAWVGNGTGNPWAYPQLTADYITKWVQGADTVYGLSIDYVGSWNEKAYNITYLETLRSALDAAGYANTLIVGTDTYEDWSIAGDILTNPQVAATVDVLGVHYPGTHSSAQAVQTGRPLWASEDMSVYNDFFGASCWARILNQNFVNGNMTTTIAWNLISSYYRGLDWYGTSILSAPEPWSGYYDTDNMGLVWVTAHTTHFAVPGWLGQGSGTLVNGGSYVTLTDGTDFSIIIEKMGWDHSQCSWESVPSYSVTAENATFTLLGSYASVQQLNVYRTAFSWDNMLQINASYLEQVGSVQVVNGQFTIQVLPDELYSITTLATVAKATIPASPPSQPFPNVYTDDFESYNISSEANYFADQAGSFEIIQTNGPNGKVMRQAVPELPILWLRNDFAPYSVIGDVQWSDTIVSISVLIESTGAAYIGARSGTCCNPPGLYFSISVTSQAWALSTNLDVENPASHLLSGALNVTANTWYNISMSVIGNVVSCWVNQDEVVGGYDAGYVVPTITQGWAAIGTSVQPNNIFTTAQFDNFQVYGNRLQCPTPSEGNGVVVTWCGEPNTANTIWQFSSSGQLQLKANPTLCVTGSSEPLGPSTSLALTIEVCTPGNPAQMFAFNPNQFPSTLYQTATQNVVSLDGNSLIVISGQLGVMIETCSSSNLEQSFVFNGSANQAGTIQLSPNLCLQGSCSSGSGCYPGLLVPCDASLASQQWKYNSNNEFVSVASGYCLDAQGGSGPVVGLYPCVGSSNQQWTVNSNSIVNVRNVNQCLTEDVPSNSQTAPIAVNESGELSLSGNFLNTQCIGVCDV